MSEDSDVPGLCESSDESEDDSDMDFDNFQEELKPKAKAKKAKAKKAQPKKAEPKKAEPKKAEPKKVEPKKAEPKKAEKKQNNNSDSQKVEKLNNKIGTMQNELTGLYDAQKEWGEESKKILRELRSGKLEMPVQDLTSDALTYLRAQVEEEIIQREVNKAVQKEVQKVLAERATDDDNQCQICYERPQGHCLIPCGHRMCKECTVSYGGAKSNCPFCQREISQSIQMF